MNSKKDKIELLKAVANGTIKPEDISSEPIIVSDGKEALQGLMISVVNKKAGKKSPVVLVGEARDLMEKTKENIKSLRQNNKA